MRRKIKSDYSKEILKLLGDEYSKANNEEIATTVISEIKVHHNICNHEFSISLKKCREKGKCPFCYSKGQQKSLKYFKQLVEGLYNGDFIFVGTEMRKNSRFFKVKHKNCADNASPEFWISMYSFKHKRPACPFCEKTLTKKQAQEKVDSIFPGEFEILDNENYFVNKKIKMRHIPCGNIIYSRLNQIFSQSQHACKFCRTKKCIEKSKRTRDEFLKILHNRFDDRFSIYTKDKYIGYHDKVEGFDYLKDKTFKMKASSLLDLSLLPHKSKGELEIEKFLKDNNIQFETEKVYDDLKDICRLKFDFYIPEKDILIEYDGEQHFYRRRDDLDGKKLEKTKKHDEMKNKYCKKNKITLIRISYKEIKNINKILTNAIMGS